MSSTAVFKQGRFHPSTELLCQTFGIDFRHSYSLPPGNSLITKMRDILRAPKEAEILKGHETFFLEGLSCGNLIPHLKRQNSHCRIIAKGNSHEPFYLRQNPLWRAAFRRLDLDRNLDGLIAVSNMIKEDFEKRFIFPIEVAEGFMYREYENLVALNPRPGQRNFLFIGKNPYLKGLDLMMELFIRLKRDRVIPPETLFYIIGSESAAWIHSNYTRKQQTAHGLHPVETTDHIEKYFQESFFQFHLARYEPNAVALMEGMAAGLIPVISSSCGNRDFIEGIADELILKASKPEGLYENLCKQLNRETRVYDKWRKDFKDQSRRYETQQGLKRWKKAWERLMDNNHG